MCLRGPNVVLNLCCLAKKLLSSTKCFTWNIDKGKGKSAWRQVYGVSQYHTGRRTKVAASGQPGLRRGRQFVDPYPLAFRKAGRYGPGVRAAGAIAPKGMAPGRQNVSY